MYLQIILFTIVSITSINSTPLFKYEDNNNDVENNYHRDSDPWALCKNHPSYEDEPSTFIQCEFGEVCKYFPRDFVSPQKSMHCERIQNTYMNRIKKELIVRWLDELSAH